MKSMQKVASPEILGLSRLVRLAFEQRNLAPVWQDLLDRIADNPGDASALLDLSVMLHTSGKRDKAREIQSAALRLRQVFTCRHGTGQGLKVLAFVTAGDFMANTPLDFLLETSNMQLILVYVDAHTAVLPEIPDHDVAFVGIGESPSNAAVLENLQRLLVDWNGAIVNNAPDRITALTRDNVASIFSGETSILAPPTHRVARHKLLQLASEKIHVSVLLPKHDFPVILRPLGSHAGEGMEKIDTPLDIFNYLSRNGEDEFFLSPYINYAGLDRKFRKQRIAFINGKAFACHLGVSQNWMVHYLNAQMLDNAAHREEEARWMEHFDEFAHKHCQAFAALSHIIGLDYFGIDCAEMPDGRLLLFEVDVAMIVHDMDPRDCFPYKEKAMRKVFQAFQDFLQEKADIVKLERDVLPTFLFGKLGMNIPVAHNQNAPTATF